MRNSTKNNNSYYPEDVIASTLLKANMYFTYYVEFSAINYYNKSYPVYKTCQADTPKLFYEFAYIYYLTLNILLYSSEDGSVAQDFTFFNSYNILMSNFEKDVVYETLLFISEQQEDFNYK